MEWIDGIILNSLPLPRIQWLTEGIGEGQMDGRMNGQMTRWQIG